MYAEFEKKLMSHIFKSRNIKEIHLFDLKERLAGFALMTVVVPMAILGYLIIVLIGFCGPVSRGRAGVRALDHFVNATVFNGYAWESV